MSKTYKKGNKIQYNTGAQKMHLKVLFGPGKCECTLLEMVLGVLCEGGQEELKKTSETYKKRKFKKNTIPGTKHCI